MSSLLQLDGDVGAPKRRSTWRLDDSQLRLGREIPARTPRWDAASEDDEPAAARVAQAKKFLSGLRQRVQVPRLGLEGDVRPHPRP